jgi:hypothetical protein
MNNTGSSSSPGYDEEDLSSTKIAPLDSPGKNHVGHEHTHGVIGEDYILQSSHIEPFVGNPKMGSSQQGGLSPFPSFGAELSISHQKVAECCVLSSCLFVSGQKPNIARSPQRASPTA